MSASKEEVTAVVKWFNQFKGYGFISVEGIDEDIFLHFSVLERGNISNLNNGDVILCTISHNDRGYQVDSIIKVLQTSKYEVDPKTMEVIAQTKWFNPLKGFGFAQLPTGEDVFIHASLLMKNGIKTLKPNVSIKMIIRQTNFGYEAIDIKPTE